jgi:tricorn protease-like protein
MPLWNVANVQDNPSVRLSSWTIRELPDGNRHFVGYNARHFEGRASTKIVEFDFVKMRGRTNSGRVYQLDGPAGMNSDAEYVWSAWCRINGYDPASSKIVSLDELKPIESAQEAAAFSA